MKTKKLFLMVAMLLTSVCTFAQNNTSLKGDVNGDGKVDVADIVAILEIMKNGTKELQSIKWATTTAVNGTTGTTPSLGDITLTYNDGTTGTVAYNASGVTLFTDAAGNTPFSNANPGTFNVWAKYCGMTTTNSKQVTLSAPVAGTYYWYVGTTKPTSLSQASVVESYPAEQTYTNNSGAKAHIFVLTNSNKNVTFINIATGNPVDQNEVDTTTISGYKIFETAVGTANTGSIKIRIS